MDTTIELIKKHRSIRKFTNEQIEGDVLADIIQAGQAAATSSYIQACSVVRITDKETRQACVELSGNQKYILAAAEFLVFCADLNRNKERVTQRGVDGDFAWTEQAIAATVDVGLFAQNVVIASESLGLGCCYIGGIRNNPEKVCELLELPELVYPVFGLCIGYPDQNPPTKPRLPLDVALHQNTYKSAAVLKSEIDVYDEQVQAYYQLRSGGKLDFDWSTQMAKQAETQTRPFMQQFLQSKGFLKK